MANDTTGKCWEVDTAATLVAAGTEIVVEAVDYYPAAASNVAHFSEYKADGSTTQHAFVFGAGAVDAAPRNLVFPNGGRRFNGLVLDSITAGTIYLYVKK